MISLLDKAIYHESANIYMYTVNNEKCNLFSFHCDWNKQVNNILWCYTNISSTFKTFSWITLGVLFAKNHENIIRDGSFENDDVSTMIDWSLLAFIGVGCMFGLGFNEQLELFNEAVEHNRVQFVLRYFSQDNVSNRLIQLHLVIYVNRRWKSKCIWWQVNTQVSFWLGIYVYKTYTTIILLFCQHVMWS